MIRKRLTAFTCLLFLYAALFAQTETKDYATADSLINAGQFEKSISILDQLIKQYGDKQTYLTSRGFAWLQLNNNEKARADYEKALANDPSCAKCHGNLGIIAAANGKIAEAISHYDSYIKLEPAKALGYVKRGEIEYQQAEYDKAMTDFNKGLTIDVNSPYIYLWMSMTELARGDAKAALAAINESIRYKPEVEYAYFMRGKCWLQLAQYDSAWKDLSTCLQKNAGYSEYHTYAGIALYNLGDYNKALKAFNQSIKLDSSNYFPFRYRSYVFYTLGYFTNACSDKQKAWGLATAAHVDLSEIKLLENEMDEYCDLSTPLAHYHSARILFETGQYDKAAQAYSNGIKLFPDEPLLLEGRGNAAIAQQQFAEALSYYHRCVQHLGTLNTKVLQAGTSGDEKAAGDFFTVQLYNSMAFAHANLTHIDSAIYWQSKAIDILQQNKNIYSQRTILSDHLTKRGSLYIIRQNYQAAEKDISEALRINDHNAQAYEDRANLLIKKNTIDESFNDDKIKAVPKNNLPAKSSMATTPLKNWKPQEVEAALSDCDKAITLNPRSAWAHLLRAQATLLLKRDHYCDDINDAIKLGAKNAAEMLGVECK